MIRIIVKDHFANVGTNTLLIHLLVWIVYIAIELLVLVGYTHKLESPAVYVVYYTLNILFFYGVLGSFNYGLTEPKKSLLYRIYRLMIVLFLYLGAKFLANYLLNPATFSFSPPHFFKDFLITTIYRGYVFAIPAIFYAVASHLANVKRGVVESEKKQLIIQMEKAELEKKLAVSHNAFLQQQLNPHLLFNSLNFVYSEVFKTSADAARAIALLSDILRYSLETTDADGRRPLSEEIEQIANLVAINQLRFNQTLNLEVKLNGHFQSRKIIPLILLTLTENIFKHGQLHDSAAPALLKIDLDDTGHLHFYIRNLKKMASGHRRLSAIGVRNVRLRLDYAYGGQYELQITDSADFYELTLNLML